MAKVYSFFADGLEEIEALAPVDVLRRAGHEVVTVSIMGRTLIHGAHSIDLMADAVFEELSFEDGDLFILPGGGLGTQNLNAHEALGSLLVKKAGEGKRVAAICAAPMVLAKLGIIGTKKAVIYPGMEGELGNADVQNLPTVTDGNVTTGHGPGAAIDFALELVRLLNGEEAAKKMKAQLVFQHESVI